VVGVTVVVLMFVRFPVYLRSGFFNCPIVRSSMIAKGFFWGHTGYGAKPIPSWLLSTHNVSLRPGFTATVIRTPLLQLSLSRIPKTAGSGFEVFDPQSSIMFL